MKPYLMLPHGAFGFEGTKDFLQTAFGLKYRHIVLWDICFITICLTMSFLTRFIWSDLDQFLTLMCLVAADTLLGTHLAWRRHKFETRKFTRSLWVVVYYIVALTAVHNFARLTPELKMIVPLVFFWLAGKSFLSIVKNLALLGVPMPPALKAIVMNKIDSFKNVDAESTEEKTEPTDEKVNQ